jgi:anthranilate/para-aminobenzoate synthase component II
MTILIIDNTGGDKNVYLPKILDIFTRHNISYIMINTKRQLDSLKEPIAAVLLSESPPLFGNKKPKEDRELNAMTIEKYMNKVPIVGICFGCQFINTHFGGTLMKLDEAFCGPTRVSFGDESQLQIQYCLRYVIDKLAPDFKALAHSTIHGIRFPCFIAHKKKEIYGMLFHPEYLKDTEHLLHKIFKSFY